MSDNYDIVTIGSGHNGLIAAAYLAEVGQKVLVLERNPWFGGGVVTRELTRPGFRHDQHSMAHIFIQANPVLKDDDLGLKSKYGLEYIIPDLPMISVFEDGQTLGLYRDREKTVQEIAKFSSKDAEAYRWLADKAAGYLPMIVGSLYTSPAPLGPTYALMDQSREGREMWRYMQMSSHDFLCSVFESNRVRMHFARIAGENLVSPDEKATAMGAFVFVGFLEAYGFGIAAGGSGSLTDALIAHIRDHGGEVLAEADVARVIVENGRAGGVETTDGRKFSAANGVIGAIHPHDISTMVAGVPPEIVSDADATQISEIGCITVHAALEEPLQFKADGVDAVMIELLPNDYDTLRKSFDDLRYGELARHPLVGLGSISMFDSSRAPEGKATMHAWDYVPYERADGKHWDDVKHDYVARMLEHIRKYVDNLDDSKIIAYHSDSPLDMERTSSSFRRGDLHGVAATTYQYGAHRPTPDLGQNVVPGCERLYLVGPFQHPGGGVFGAGRAAAMKAMEDLGIDF